MPKACQNGLDIALEQVGQWYGQYIGGSGEVQGMDQAQPGCVEGSLEADISGSSGTYVWPWVQDTPLDPLEFMPLRAGAEPYRPIGDQAAMEQALIKDFLLTSPLLTSQGRIVS